MPSKKVSMRASMANQTSHFGIMGGLYNRKISGRSSTNRVTSRLKIPAGADAGLRYMKLHNLLSRNPLGSGGVGRMFNIRPRGSGLGSHLGNVKPTTDNLGDSLGDEDNLGDSLGNVCSQFLDKCTSCEDKAGYGCYCDGALTCKPIPKVCVGGINDGSDCRVITDMCGFGGGKCANGPYSGSMIAPPGPGMCATYHSPDKHITCPRGKTSTCGDMGGSCLAGEVCVDINTNTCSSTPTPTPSVPPLCDYKTGADCEMITPSSDVKTCATAVLHACASNTPGASKTPGWDNGFGKDSTAYKDLSKGAWKYMLCGQDGTALKDGTSAPCKDFPNSCGADNSVVLINCKNWDGTTSQPTTDAKNAVNNGGFTCPTPEDLPTIAIKKNKLRKTWNTDCTLVSCGICSPTPCTTYSSCKEEHCTLCSALNNKCINAKTCRPVTSTGGASGSCTPKTGGSGICQTTPGNQPLNCSIGECSGNNNDLGCIMSTPDGSFCCFDGQGGDGCNTSENLCGLNNNTKKICGTPVKPCNTTPPTTLKKFCGTNYGDANTNCPKTCPDGTDAHCAPGTYCFAVPDC